METRLHSEAYQVHRLWWRSLRPAAGSLATYERNLARGVLASRRMPIFITGPKITLKNASYSAQGRRGSSGLGRLEGKENFRNTSEVYRFLTGTVQRLS